MIARRAALLTGLAALAAAPAMARVKIEKDPWPTGEARRAFKRKPYEPDQEGIRAFWLDGGRGREIWLVEAHYDRLKGPLLRQAQAIGRGRYDDYEFFRLADRTVPMKPADYQAVRDSCFGLIQDWLKTPAGFQSVTGESVCLDWCGGGVEVAGVPGQAPLAIAFDGAAEIIGARMRLAAEPYHA
jgi:hypothetical protein